MAPLIILPGLMCDSRMFGDQLAAFHDAQVVDGFYAGCSTISAMAAYALDRMPGRAALLGHSMGARVALEIVRQAPERVARLALASTGTHDVRPGEREGRYRLRDLGREQGAAALVDAWLPPMLGADAARDPGLVAHLRAMCIAAGVDAFTAQAEALLSRPSLADLLPQVAVPTLVIVGSEDRWAPVEQHAAIAAAIPGAQLRVIADAGHMLPAERPAAFNAALSEWLSP